MIIAIDGPGTSDLINSFPMFATCLFEGWIGCALLPANIAIYTAVVLGAVAGASMVVRNETMARRLAKWGLLASSFFGIASTAVMLAFYWTADPINTETWYPSLGPYFDLGNSLFGISLLMLSAFLGVRLGCSLGRAGGFGAAP